MKVFHQLDNHLCYYLFQNYSQVQALLIMTNVKTGVVSLCFSHTIRSHNALKKKKSTFWRKLTLSEPQVSPGSVTKPVNHWIHLVTISLKVQLTCGWIVSVNLYRMSQYVDNMTAGIPLNMACSFLSCLSCSNSHVQHPHDDVSLVFHAQYHTLMSFTKSLMMLDGAHNLLASVTEQEMFVMKNIT